MSENLLTDEERRKLSQETQDSLEALREFWTMTRGPNEAAAKAEWRFQFRFKVISEASGMSDIGR